MSNTRSMEAHDNRLRHLNDSIVRLLPLDLQKKAGGDADLDAIISNMNLLEEELNDQKKMAADKASRINALIEVLLEYTTMNFSQRATISEERDEIDAVAAGLNALADEFQNLLQVQAQNDDQLKAKAEELEASNNDLEAFSYSISHDLRAPLRAILGYSQIMVEDYATSLDEEAARLLAAITANASKMSKLINDLLEFSRLGRRELLKMRLDPTRIAHIAFAQVTETREFKGEITIHDMPPVHADRSLFMQVYLNLLSNAVKYTSKKPSPRIEIGTTTTARGDAFYVKDNGAGFNMRYYDRLFEVFRRLHGEKDFEGTGVGLAIVKRIVQRHGGAIWAESKVNEGAVFYFTMGE